MRSASFASITVILLSGLLLASAGCSGTTTVNTSSNNGGSSGSGGAEGGSNTGGTAQGGSTGGAGGTTSTCTASEELCDGMDNDCDGSVDEGCPCTAGQTMQCYAGPAATKGVGSCKEGTQTCDVHGQWGECVNQVLPQSETCDNIDNDCNGVLDDVGFQSCGFGACKVTVPTCANGQKVECVPGLPTIEVCDGIDNNCNQLIDESFPEKGQTCDTGQAGQCGPGKMSCLMQNGTGQLECVPDKTPTMEQCDGVDNDCDGNVDDNIIGTGAACSTGLPGSCNNGTVSCQGGVIDCFPNTPISAEVCDGIDNDCNGPVDDLPGAGQPCDTGLLGACKAGIQMCQANGSFGCVQQVQAQATDQCGDGIDNDCDGTVDEGCMLLFSGVQVNLPINQLGGWTQCYIDTYANGSTALSTIQNQCSKAKLLMGCRQTGSATLLVAAWAPRTDVLFDTGTGNVPHNANNVGWYYNSSYSWGFAPQGDVITRSSCDTTGSSFDGFAGADPTKRLCWHTGGGLINGGWRCGMNDSLNGSSTYERIVYHAD